MEISRAKRIRTNSPTVISFEVSASLTPELRDLFQKGIEKTGDVYTLEIEPFKKPRTTGPFSQSHHINGHVQQLAAAAGTSFEIMKRYVKIRAAELGYPSEIWHGIVEPKSEAKATVEEAIMLIDAAHLIATEINVTLYEGDGWVN